MRTETGKMETCTIEKTTKAYFVLKKLIKPIAPINTNKEKRGETTISRMKTRTLLTILR